MKYRVLGKSKYASMETSGDTSGDWLQLERDTFDDLKQRKKIRSNIQWEDLQDTKIYDEVATAYQDDLETTFEIPKEDQALWSYRPSWYKKYGGKIENIPDDARGSFGKSGREAMQTRINNLEKNYKGEIQQREMQKAQAKMQQEAYERWKADPKNWTYKQSQDYFRSNPPQTKEEEIQEEIFLKEKKHRQKEEMDRVTAAEHFKENIANTPGISHFLDWAANILPKEFWNRAEQAGRGFIGEGVEAVKTGIPKIALGMSYVPGVESDETAKEKEQMLKEGVASVGKFALDVYAIPPETARALTSAAVDLSQGKPASKIMGAIFAGTLGMKEAETVTSRVPFSKAEQGHWARLIPRATAEAVETMLMYRFTYGDPVGRMKRAYKNNKLEGAMKEYDKFTDEAAKQIVDNPRKFNIKFPKSFTPEDKLGLSKAYVQNRLGVVPEVGDFFLKRQSLMNRLATSLRSRKGAVSLPEPSLPKGKLKISEITGGLKSVMDKLASEGVTPEITKNLESKDVSELNKQLGEAEPPKIPPKDIEGLEGPDGEGKFLRDSYEKLKEIWFQNKDERIFLAQVERRNLQNEIKQTLGKNKYDQEAKDMDKAIQIYIDSKRNPEHINQYYDQLSLEQQKIVGLSQSLPAEIQPIADKIDASYQAIGQEALGKEIIKNVLDNYVARIWDLEGKTGSEQFRKFGTTTRHAKVRKLETIIEGWAKGYKLKVEGATNNLEILKNEIVKTIEDKNLVKALQKIKTIDGDSLLSTFQREGYSRVEHPNFTTWKWSGKVDPMDPEKTKMFARNSFIDENGNIFERRELYAPKKIAANLNNILGISKLKGKPVIDTLTKYNAIIKAWVLQSSFFHHMAFLRSYWFGTNHKKWMEMSPRQAYKQGIKAIEEQNPILIRGVRNGLTLGIKQDWAEELLKEKTLIGNILDRWGTSKVVKDKIMALRQAQADFLFGEYGAGLKAKSFLIEYHNLLKRYPNTDPDRIAKTVANLINDDFGGLHLGRLGRDPTLQHIFRLFALAPDWTESNIRTMTKIFQIKSGVSWFSQSKMEANFYRKFWAGILTKGILLSVMANLLLNGKDTLKNYKRAFKDPLRFRWLDVDITNIYRALGGTSKDRKYFSILGHFKDPIKFITHPIRSAHHKGSFIYKFFHEALVGTDWAGRRFTTLSEILGRDYEKGEYKTTRKGKYKKGDPKYGKLAGKTVTWDYGKRGPLNYNQIPSFIISQLKGSQPIQIQNLLGWWAGEIAGFDASAKSLGLRVSTAYEQREEKKKKRYKVVK